jgi:hypothetical protein
MQFDPSTSSAESVGVGAVDDLLRRFDELAEEDQGAFIEALIRKEKIYRIMNLVAKCAQARIEGSRDP